MLTISKKDFRRKLEADLNSDNNHKEEDDLPEEMIEDLTANVEVDDESPEPDISEKAKSLANEIKETTGTEAKADGGSNRSNGKKYFQVDVDTKANVRGVKFKGHTGIEITDFEFSISTKSNAAVYNQCEVFLGNGNNDDNFDVWGKYTGKMKKSVNDEKEARFEFYLRGKNLTITYWKSHKYQDKAKKMAKRAISLIKQALK